MTDLTQSWWSYSMRGMLAIFFGILCLVTPAMSLVYLVAMVGAFWLLDGVTALLAAGAAIHEHDPWGWLVLEGVVSLAAAVATWSHTGISALILAAFIGLWAVCTGILKLGAAIRLRYVLRHEWLLGTSGLLSLLVGLLLLFRPGSGLQGLVSLVGVYALVFGALLIGLGFRMRGLTFGPGDHIAGT